MSKATKLCAFELIGGAELMTTEEEYYAAVTPDSLLRAAAVFVPGKSNTMLYQASKE
jgi:hypothetical protein